MKSPLLMLFAVAIAGAQEPRPVPPRPDVQRDRRLPDGRSQNEAILKADHEKSLRDATELMKLTDDLKIDLEKNDRHVLSVSTLKKLDEIEKIARRIRSRMKRF